MANKKNIRKWVQLLRSGKFKQGRWQLYTPESGAYCCLGVACVAAGMKPRGGKFGSEEFDLPVTAQRWLGVDRTDPRLRGTSAADLNDNGASFAQLADLIEEELLSQG